MKNTIRVWLIFLPALCAGSVFAAITGKIAGRVVDAETGEPLVGVNVFISSTTMGAATDANGDFFILNIPPGKYDIQTQMIGYSVMKMENVQVRTNATTTLNFKMKTTVIKGETITVTVDAIATKKDQTSSVRNISADQIEALPVESINQVIDMQPGVIDGHFRGGRSNEVTYMLDGMQVTDVYDRGRLVEVEKEVIQDVEVILGTFNAEYGRAMSGVVNAVT
ncbi:TonB-dependent receptor, partial [candidate division KSB1 bacterium]|nr:TonB-dependent receptor [candidate division KSB1 bacterium]